VLIGAALLGILGVLVAIPTAAAIQIILRDWWKAQNEDETDFEGEEIASVDGDGDDDATASAGGGEPTSDDGGELVSDEDTIVSDGATT
jgi:hypothetical protein